MLSHLWLDSKWLGLASWHVLSIACWALKPRLNPQKKCWVSIPSNKSEPKITTPVISTVLKPLGYQGWTSFCCRWEFDRGRWRTTAHCLGQKCPRLLWKNRYIKSIVLPVSVVSDFNSLFKHLQSLFNSEKLGGPISPISPCTIWLFNIAMENGPFIDGFPS